MSLDFSNFAFRFPVLASFLISVIFPGEWIASMLGSQSKEVAGGPLRRHATTCETASS